MNEQEMLNVKKEAEEIIDKGEAPSLDVIRKLMKSSGKSFVQVMKETKKMKKSMDEARAKAESEGKYFSETEYLKAQMDQSSKKVIYVRR